MRPRELWQRVLAWCLPAESRLNHPWLGWVLVGSLVLFLVFLLASLGVFLYTIDSFVGAGPHNLDGKGGFDFGPGLALARLWLLSLLSVPVLCLFRIWWLFAKEDRPREVHQAMAGARRGEPGAAHQVALHYADRDPSAARAWLLRAAQGGSAQAMVDLARELREGRGGPKDLPTARAWVLRAAEAGAPGAEALLGEIEAQLGDRYSTLGR